MAKINKTKFKKAVEGSGGILTSIAERIGVSRKSLYEWLAKNPEMLKFKQDEEEKILDLGEASLFSQLKNQEKWAVKYLLSTKGKTRGYVEKQEVGVTTTDTLSKEQVDELIERLKK